MENVKDNNVVATIDWDLSKNISYKTQLGKSLKNTLRKFDREDLFEELSLMIEYFTEVATEGILATENRIKSLQSCKMKYEKYFPSTPVEKVFNDVLGLRIIVDNYEMVDKLISPENSRIVDMRKGKSIDDGYRAIHVYYQKDHHHYPIEIQFMTPRDRQFNEWLHIYLYKVIDDQSIGATLRKRYENGDIRTEDRFKEEVQNVLSNCKIS